MNQFETIDDLEVNAEDVLELVSNTATVRYVQTRGQLAGKSVFGCHMTILGKRYVQSSGTESVDEPTSVKMKIAQDAVIARWVASINGTPYLGTIPPDNSELKHLVLVNRLKDLATPLQIARANSIKNKRRLASKEKPYVLSERHSRI